MWAKVQVAYPITATFGFGTDFTKVQAFIKGATSSDDGQSMLKAQFIATALNTQYLATGYGAQGVQVSCCCC